MADRLALLNAFGIETGSSSWLTDLLEGGQEQLIGLAKYLDVRVPGEAERDEIPPAHDIDTYSELVAAETAFREIVRSAIGPSWIDDFTADTVEALREKRDAEDKRRDGVTVSQDLLD
jgi:hypothetical protein